MEAKEAEKNAQNHYKAKNGNEQHTKNEWIKQKTSGRSGCTLNLARIFYIVHLTQGFFFLHSSILSRWLLRWYFFVVQLVDRDLGFYYVSFSSPLFGNLTLTAPLALFEFLACVPCLFLSLFLRRMLCAISFSLLSSGFARFVRIQQSTMITMTDLVAFLLLVG